MTPDRSDAPVRVPILDRIGFPHGFGWGLVAVIIFMIGDGIESTWLSNYLATAHGYSLTAAGWVVTSYGIVVAIGAFFAGALSDTMGARKVMTIGVGSFILFDLLFILAGLPSGNYALLLVTYCMRGLGYPLFGYGLLTWMMSIAPAGKGSSTAGWFWFAFSLGGQILGSFAASALLPSVGALATLWIGLVAVIVGGVGGLTMIRGGGAPANSEGGADVVGALWRGLSIIWRVPKIGLGGLVKVINLAGISGLAVFYVPYLVGTIGLDESSAILVFTVMGVFAVIGNLVWGFIGDILGYRRTTQWFATTLCFIGTLYLYYMPQVVGPNFAAIAIGGLIMGAGLSAFVPLTALMAGLAPEETGSALSIVNLGSGLATFVGPALAAIFIAPLGISGVVWVFAGMYAAAFVIMAFIRLPNDAKTTAEIPVADEPVTQVA